MYLLRILAAALFVIVSAVAVFPQANAKGKWHGDYQNGAGVPGATVKLQNQATKIESESVTNESGYFNFVNLNPAYLHVESRSAGIQGRADSSF